ncbi:MAG: hypothetical protein WB341_00225 [Terracidiphilus sp.]
MNPHQIATKSQPSSAGKSAAELPNAERFLTLLNRETSVKIGGRSTMLRIPVTFDVTPIERLQSPEDLYKITLLSAGESAR